MEGEPKWENRESLLAKPEAYKIVVTQMSPIEYSPGSLSKVTESRGWPSSD